LLHFAFMQIDARSKHGRIVERQKPRVESFSRTPAAKHPPGRLEARVDAGIGANGVADEVTRRIGFDGKIRLVTSAATAS